MADQQITIDIRAVTNLAKSISQLEGLGQSIKQIQNIINKGALRPATAGVYRPLKSMIDDVTALSAQYKNLAATSKVLGAGSIGSKTQFFSQAQGMAALRGETEKFAGTIGRFQKYKEVLGAFTGKGFPAYANRTGGPRGLGPGIWNLMNAQEPAMRNLRQQDLEAAFSGRPGRGGLYRPPPGANAPPGMLGGGPGGGRGSNRFNFGQIFSGFIYMGLAKSISDFVSTSVSEFAKFELAVARISTVSGEATSTIKSDIMELASVVPFSMEQLSDAFLVAGQAGLKSAEDIKSVVFAASLLSFRFGDDLGQTTKRLIQISTQFNLEISQSGALLGLLGKVSGDTLADIDSLANALSRAGATAKAANITIYETAAAIGAAAQAGIESQRAGTELRRLITELEQLAGGNVTKKQGLIAQKIFGEDFRAQVDIGRRGFASIIDDIAKSGAKISDLSTLVGEIPGRILSGLVVFSQGLQKSGDSFAEFQQRLVDGTETFDDFKLLFGELSARGQVLENQFKALKISFGEAFAPLVDVGIVVVSEMLNFLKEMSPTTKVLTLAITGLTAALIGLSLILPVVVGFLGPFGVTLYAVAVAAAVLLGASKDFEQFFKNIKMALYGVYSVIETMIPGLKLFATVFWPLLKNNVKEVNAAFGMFESKAKNITQDVFLSMNNEIKKVIDSIKGLDDAAKKDVFEKLTAGMRKTITATKELRAETEKYIALFPKMAINSQEDFQKMADGLVTTWGDAIFDLITGAKTFGDVWHDVQMWALRDFIDGFLKGMMGSWSEALGQMLAQYIFFSQNTGMGGGSNFMKILGMVGGAFNLGGAVANPSGMMPGPSPSSYPAGAFGAAEGGIATGAKPLIGMFGEAGPEAFIPLNRMGGLGLGKQQNITVVNIVDQNFVSQTLIDEPDVIINTINADLIRNGTTRKTIKRYTQ